MTRSIEDALAGGAPVAKFPTVGAKIKGTVLDAVEQQDVDFDTKEGKVWKNTGEPMMVWVITLATDQRDDTVVGDDGQRRLFAKSKMWQAIRAAHKEAGGGKFVGGELGVAYSGDGERDGNKNPPKLYVAKFTPGAASVDKALDSPFDGGQPAKVSASDLLD